MKLLVALSTLLAVSPAEDAKVVAAPLPYYAGYPYAGYGYAGGGEQGCVLGSSQGTVLQCSVPCSPPLPPSSDFPLSTNRTNPMPSLPDS